MKSKKQEIIRLLNQGLTPKQAAERTGVGHTYACCVKKGMNGAHLLTDKRAAILRGEAQDMTSPSVFRIVERIPKNCRMEWLDAYDSIVLIQELLAERGLFLESIVIANKEQNITAKYHHEN